jgi:predicted DNA-binding transcriptional regulator
MLGRFPNPWQYESMSNNAPDSRLSLDTTPEPHNPRGYEAELDPLFFQQIPNVLINDVAKNRLKPIDVIVYAVLKKHVGNNACCWAGNRTVARLCGVSNATVRRSIKNLVRAGHIERKNCTDGKAAYTYLRTTVVDGRAVCGVPPVPPRQSCHTQTLAALSATIAPVARHCR